MKVIKATERQIVFEDKLVKDQTFVTIITLHRLRKDDDWRFKLESNHLIRDGALHLCSLDHMQRILVDMSKAIEAYNKEQETEADDNKVLKFIKNPITFLSK